MLENLASATILTSNMTYGKRLAYCTYCYTRMSKVALSTLPSLANSLNTFPERRMKALTRILRES